MSSREKRRKEFWNYDIKFKDEAYFENIHKPVEVFCSKLYKGYFFRGQIAECPFPSRCFPNRQPENYYRLMLLSFVSQSCRSPKAYSDLPEDYRIGMIYGKTKAEFLKIRKSADNTQDLHSLIELNAEDLKVLDFSHVNEEIAGGKESVLVGLRMIGIGEDFKKVSKLGIRLHPFLATYFSPEEYDDADDVHNWFSTLYDTLCFRFDYRDVRKQDFFAVLNEVGGLSCQYLTEGITDDLISRFNASYEMLLSVNNPLINFCFDFMRDLSEDLQKSKVLSICQFCGMHFPYKKGKWYCSLLAEGRDCGKKARNKRFYEAHQKRLQKKSRGTMKELRDYYRSKGVRK